MRCLSGDFASGSSDHEVTRAVDLVRLFGAWPWCIGSIDPAKHEDSQLNRFLEPGLGAVAKLLQDDLHLAVGVLKDGCSVGVWSVRWKAVTPLGELHGLDEEWMRQAG